MNRCLECSREARSGEVVIGIGLGLWYHKECLEKVRHNGTIQKKIKDFLKESEWIKEIR